MFLGGGYVCGIMDSVSEQEIGDRVQYLVALHSFTQETPLGKVRIYFFSSARD